MTNGNVCYVLGRNKFSCIFQTRKVLEVQRVKSLKSDDSKYRIEWASEFAETVKGSEETIEKKKKKSAYRNGQKCSSA